MIYAIVIDDSRLVIKDFLLEVKGFPDLTIIATFEGVEEASHFLLEHGKVNIVFCDIQMPDISGLDAVALLQPHYDYFIAISGFTEYTTAAFEKDVDAYLFKPVKAADVRKKLIKLKRLQQKDFEKRFHYFVKQTGEPVEDLLDLRRVLVITSKHNDVFFTVEDPQILYTATVSLTRLEATYSDLFIRIHRSTLVARKAIVKITEGKVWLSNEKEYTVSETYREQLRRFVAEHKINNLLKNSV